MRAIVQDQFGGPEVLELRDVALPHPGEGQMLVRVLATNVNPIDWKMREGQMAARYGDEFPMLLGWDCSGVVEAVGPGVTSWRRGDEVFARSDVGTGRCYAEYAVLNCSTVWRKPARLTHEEAGSLPLVGLTAINGLIHCVNLRAGQRVLVIGASGGVGTLAVQIANNLGAEVTGVCSSRNIELVKSLGVDEVVNYETVDPLAASEPYDVVYDTVGIYAAEEARRALTEDGTYLTLVPSEGIEFFVPGQTEWQPGKGYFVAWSPAAKDLQMLADWAEQGRLQAVIDSVYPLEDIIQAHLRSQTGRAAGKIVIQVGSV